MTPAEFDELMELMKTGKKTLAQIDRLGELAVRYNAAATAANRKA